MTKSNKEYMAIWRAKNKEKIKEYQKKYRESHPDSVKKIARENYLKTREKDPLYYTAEKRVERLKSRGEEEREKLLKDFKYLLGLGTVEIIKK